MLRINTIFLLILFGSNLYAQEIKIEREVRMLALGDSYTIGQSVDVSDRWPHQFIDELRAMGAVAEYPHYIATTGWTTQNLISGIENTLNREKNYNLVSILIGVNNQYQGISISIYEPDLRTIIDTALSIVIQDSSRIMILSIPDYAFTPFGNGNPNISREIDQYNAIKKKVADEYGIAFINITPISRNGLATPSLVASDGLHPSGLQYGLWVNEIMPRLDVNLSVGSQNLEFPSEELVSVHPNPSRYLFHIQSEAEMGRIKVFNSTGILISDFRVNRFSFALDLSSYPDGLYILSIHHAKDRSKYYKKIIKSARL